jgi:hypothetical protein
MLTRAKSYMRLAWWSIEPAATALGQTPLEHPRLSPRFHWVLERKSRGDNELIVPEGPSRTRANLTDYAMLPVLGASAVSPDAG